MLLMIEKEIRDRICHVIHRHVKANNKYMKNYDKNIELSYNMYLDGQCLKNYLQMILNGWKSHL